MLTKTSKNRESELDALRGIAAVLVLLFHYSGLPGFDLSFLLTGVTGVDLFFIISGYVIFMTLNKTTRAKEFIVSRLSRLYPSYLAAMLIVVLMTVYISHEKFPSAILLAGNVTMMQPFFMVPYLDDVYWTLTVELQFYILMLLLFVFGKLQKIELIGIVLVLAILAYHLVSLSYSTTSKAYIWPHSFLPLISHFQLFVAGIFFYKIKNSGSSIYRHAAIVICFVSSIILFPHAGKSHYFIGIVNYTAMLLMYFAAFYLFIFGSLKFIAIKPLLFLGSISYCIYLIHLTPGYILFNVLTESFQWHRAVSTLFTIACVIGVATLVTYAIERPIIRFLRKKFSGTHEAVVVTVPELAKAL